MEPEQKIEIKDIDTKEELGAFAILNWQKVIKIIAALSLGAALVAIALSGISFNCGKNSFEKSPVKLDKK